MSERMGLTFKCCCSVLVRTESTVLKLCLSLFITHLQAQQAFSHYCVVLWFLRL